MSPPLAIAMARAALDSIDEARNQIRDARKAMMAAENTINLEMSKLHAYFSMEEAP